MRKATSRKSRDSASRSAIRRVERLQSASALSRLSRMRLLTSAQMLSKSYVMNRSPELDTELDASSIWVTSRVANLAWVCIGVEKEVDKDPNFEQNARLST